MTKSELKSTALDSMSQAGVAMQEGNYSDALNLAEKAWNCYYELQRQRSDDEDFTDLIYYARDMYYQAQEALKQQEPVDEDKDEYRSYEFTIEDLEEDLDLQLSEQKEAKENNAADSYPVFSATYDVLIAQVMLAEKRIAKGRDCWKNIQLAHDFIPGVREMLRSPHLDKQARDNMFDLSTRIFECIDNPLGSTWVLSSPRLKRELDKLVVEIAKGIPDQDCEEYEDVIQILDFYISAADDDELDEVNNQYNDMVYDHIELTARYEQLLPEADRRGEEAYRRKGENATVQDFYNAKRLYLAANGVAWTPPQETSPLD